MTAPVATRVREIIAFCASVEEPVFGEEACLEADLGMDSCDRWDALTRIEDAFEIDVDDDAWRRVGTVGDAIGLVEARVRCRDR